MESKLYKDGCGRLSAEREIVLFVPFLKLRVC